MRNRIPDGYFDMVLTSPPYDKLRRYNGFSFPFQPIARHLYRVLKWGGVIVWVVSDSSVNGSESLTSFQQALFFKEVGFRVHDTMLYRKLNFIPLNHNRCEQEFEYMFCFSKGKPKTFNPIMVKCDDAGKKFNYKRKGSPVTEGAYRKRNEIISVKAEKIHGNIFEYTTGSCRRNHPAIFPEKLAADQIGMWSNEGDIIYDPFSGSGTTCEVAAKMNRIYIGSEISAEYHQDSLKRIKHELGIFG